MLQQTQQIAFFRIDHGQRTDCRRVSSSNDVPQRKFGVHGRNLRRHQLGHAAKPREEVKFVARKLLKEIDDTLDHARTVTPENTWNLTQVIAADGRGLASQCYQFRPIGIKSWSNRSC